MLWCRNVQGLVIQMNFLIEEAGADCHARGQTGVSVGVPQRLPRPVTMGFFVGSVHNGGRSRSIASNVALYAWKSRKTSLGIPSSY